MCGKLLGVGKDATIRLSMLTLQLRHIDAESYSVLPRYVLKNGIMCIVVISIGGNPFGSPMMTSKTKRVALSSTSPP